MTLKMFHKTHNPILNRNDHPLYPIVFSETKRKKKGNNVKLLNRKQVGFVGST